MLITRPNHDLTTNYLYYWSEKIIKKADKSKESVIPIKSGNASETLEIV